MAKDVEATWISILSHAQKHQPQDDTVVQREEGAMSEKAGEDSDECGVKILEELKDSLRYLVDVWTP